MLAAFQQPAAPGEEAHLNRQWLPGYRMQLAADEALVLIDGVQQAFRINLALHSATVHSLIARAKALLQAP